MNSPKNNYNNDFLFFISKHFLIFKVTFQSRVTRLYTPLCPSVGWLVGQSVGWSPFYFFMFLPLSTRTRLGQPCIRLCFLTTLISLFVVVFIGVSIDLSVGLSKGQLYHIFVAFCFFNAMLDFLYHATYRVRKFFFYIVHNCFCNKC